MRRYNTAEDAKVVSWWDYGYQTTAMANRTVLVDNNTWNNTHIATVGRAMASSEKRAYNIYRSLDVDYVLVVFGGYLNYPSDDINKFLWMVRIAAGEFPDIKERDFVGPAGYRVDSNATPKLMESLMYKLCYYGCAPRPLPPRRGSRGLGAAGCAGMNCGGRAGTPRRRRSHSGRGGWTAHAMRSSASRTSSCATSRRCTRRSTGWCASTSSRSPRRASPSCATSCGWRRRRGRRCGRRGRRRARPVDVRRCGDLRGRHVARTCGACAWAHACSLFGAKGCACSNVTNVAARASCGKGAAKRGIAAIAYPSHVATVSALRSRAVAVPRLRAAAIFEHRVQILSRRVITHARTPRKQPGRLRTAPCLTQHTLDHSQQAH